MYYTILTRKNRRKICLALREQVLRRFFRVFSYVLYFVDIQCDMQIFCTFSFLGSVEKRAKCLVRQSILQSHLNYFASSLRLSCILTLTILQSHLDYLALPNTQRGIAKVIKWRIKAYFPCLITQFSCGCWRARKCQSSCQVI